MLSVVKRTMVVVTLAVLAACGGGGGGGGSASSGGSGTTAAPVISSQPASVSVYETQTASFSVTATGSGTMTYQWKKNGTAISGATASTYSIASAALTDSGAVSVDVTGTGGTTTSATATLAVQAATPTVTSQPTAQSVIATDTATFSVTASGLPPMTYQWYKVPASGAGANAGASIAAGATLPTGATAITGATSSSYTTKVTSADNGAKFFATIKNGKGVEIASEVSVLTVQPLVFSDLVISEVSSCYYTNLDCWFEIYNPTTSAINVSAYKVKTTTPVGYFAVPYTFSLPNVSIPALGYAIVSGNNDSRAQINAQNIHIGDSSTAPWWGASGFVELLKSGVTVDFVSFGTSTQTPATPAKWSGSPVKALPYSTTDYGKAIVRAYPITPSLTNVKGASASDWTAVNFATPGGQNDVPAGVVDSDGDGIPDSAKISGGTFAGLDLYAMGARKGQKDIFIEVDHMNSTDPGIIPQKVALQKVVDAFLAKGIHVHFDAGTTFNASFSTADFNLGQSTGTVAYEKCVTLNQTDCYLNTSTRRSVYDWKDEYMDLRRRALFHYLLFANSQKTDGGRDSSGVAEYIGNDLVVTLGGYLTDLSTATKYNTMTNYQAATIMHELGHNLGLNHGGLEETNYKPNYWSVMNYLYQLYGLDPDATASTAYQRWRFQKGDLTVNGSSTSYCAMVATACGDPAQFIINYSDGTGVDLNESALDESLNVGRGRNGGTAFADWNMNGSLTAGTSVRDLNGDGSYSVIKDYNDWANLVLPFARQYRGNAGASVNSTATTKSVLNPIAADRQKVIQETPPPAQFFEQLRSLR